MERKFVLLKGGIKMNNQEALDKVIGNFIAKLETTEAGSEEHKALVDAIAKLEDKSLEMQRRQKQENVNSRMTFLSTTLNASRWLKIAWIAG